MTTTTSIIDTSCHPDVVISDENVKRLLTRGTRPRPSPGRGLKTNFSCHLTHRGVEREECRGREPAWGMAPGWSKFKISPRSLFLLEENTRK